MAKKISNQDIKNTFIDQLINEDKIKTQNKVYCDANPREITKNWLRLQH